MNISYYRQLFENIKDGSVSAEGLKSRSNKSVINSMIFILIFVINCLSNYDIYDFLVWLITGSNPADINLFGSHICMFVTEEGEVKSRCAENGLHISSIISKAVQQITQLLQTLCSATIVVNIEIRHWC